MMSSLRTPSTSAWKRIGTDISKAKTWKEAIGLAKLDWTVEKKQVLSPYDNKPLPIFGNFRKDTGALVGRSGAEFTVVQNENAFDWVDVVVQSDPAAKYVSAGALFGGGLIWALVSTPHAIRIKGTDDVTETFLLFVNYHEAGRSAIGKLLQDRLICSNGMTATVEVERLSFPHRSTVYQNLDRGKAALVAMSHQVADLNTAMNTLAKVKLDVSTVGEILRRVYPNIDDSAQAQNRAREVLEIFEDNDGNAFPSEAGSAYALLNGFTNWIDHRSGTRPSSHDESAEVARARNALFGGGEALKFTVLTSIVTTLAQHSLASFSDKEVRALGLR